MLTIVGPSPHMLSSYGTAREDACRDMCAGEELCRKHSMSCVVGPSPHMLSSCGTAREEACREMCVGTWFFMVHFPSWLGPTQHTAGACQQLDKIDFSFRRGASTH